MRHSVLRLSDRETVLLSRLAEPWLAVALSDQTVRIQLGEHTVITLTSEGVDVAPFFECFRLNVSSSRRAVVGEPPLGFRTGAEVIQVLESEEWLARERLPPRSLVGDFIGSHCRAAPGNAPVNVEHSCIVDCGVLFTASSGQQLLIRCATTPCWLAVIQDDKTIEKELGEHRLRDLTNS